MLTKRLLLKATAAAAFGPHALSAEASQLKALAAARGLYFGTAVVRPELERDPSYAAAVLRECGVLVCGWEMKWEAIEPRRGERNYADADWVASFCDHHGLTLRGHPAIWAASLPSWVEPALAAEPALPLLRRHVHALVRHFRGRIRSWDVVNEAIEPRNGRPDGLRTSEWLRALGPAYIDEAFRAAREADPIAELVYNEAELDHATAAVDARRRAVLRLLEGFRRRGTPCDALGVQAHLWANQPIDPAPLRHFVGEVARMGYRIVVTELDVNDRDLKGTLEERDRAVADTARRYLDVMLDDAAVKGILTWGMSDRYTWLNRPVNFPEYARQDGIESRPLPLDSRLKRKPLWHAIASSIASARLRSPG